MGMSLNDFSALTYEEFTAAATAFEKRAAADFRNGWEQVREHLAVSVQPHLKKRLTKEQILRFPWDKENRVERTQAPQVSRDEAKRRLERLARHGALM